MFEGVKGIREANSYDAPSVLAPQQHDNHRVYPLTKPWKVSEDAEYKKG